MSIIDKIKNFVFLNDEDDTLHEEESQDVAPSFFSNRQTKVTNENHHGFENGEFNVMRSGQNSERQPTRIRIMEPKLYSEVRDIADVILSDESVVLNFRRMDKNQAKKVIDFLMGITYAIKGDIQRIGDDIFLCTPTGIKITGKELDAIKKGNLS